MKLTLDLALFALAGVAALTGIGLQVAGPVKYAVIGWLLAALFAAAGFVVRSPRWGTLAGAVVAFGASLYLFWLKVAPTDGPALCSVNQTIDCVSINDSPYSSLLSGTAFETPITLLGTGFFLGLILATLAAPAKAPRLFQVSALFALFNVIVSLYLASILFIETKLCVFCVTIYLANLLILWAAFRGMRQTDRGLFDDLGALLSARSLYLITAGFAGVVVLGHLTYPQGPEPSEPADEPGSKQAQDRLASLDTDTYLTPLPKPVELHGAEPAKGAEDPRYTIVEFADYACPHCRDATLEVAGLIEGTEDVQVLFKVYPLSKECNPAIPREAASNFPQRCIPALYAECARQQGRFWPVNADIFQNQQMLTNAGFALENMDRLVANRQVDMATFEACLDDPESQRMVQLDAVSGARAGVEATPSFYVKGVLDDGAWARVDMKRGVADVFMVIDAHRARQEREPPPDAAPPEASSDGAEDGTDDPTGEPSTDPSEDPTEPSGEPGAASEEG